MSIYTQEVNSIEASNFLFISVISEGQMRTAGSSVFLKKRFGNGFRLTIVKQPSAINLERWLSIHPSGVGDPIETVVTKMNKFLETNKFDEVKLVEDLGVELHYTLPSTSSELFLADFFQKLETEKLEIGIESYGLTVPSLQQIFLTIAPHREIILKKHPNIFVRIKDALCFHRRARYVAAENTPEAETDAKNLVKEDEIETTATPDDLVHPPMSFIKRRWFLWAQQCRALFIKRIHVSRRSLLPMFVELILPIMVLLAAELYAKYQIENRDTKFMVAPKPLTLTQMIYGNGTRFYVGLWNNSNADLNALIKDPGPGLRCVDNKHLKSFLGY